MTLNYEQLMETNLKGYSFSVRSEGYTMTGYGTIDEYYIVLEDNGESCVVADLDRRSKTSTWTKAKTAKCVAEHPLLEWNSETKSYQNKIEIL